MKHCHGVVEYKLNHKDENWSKGWITGFIETDLTNGKPSKRIPKSF